MAEWIKPVDLPISSGYGMRDGGFHYGIDFSDGVAGHPIRAMAAGTVVYNAYEAGGFGNPLTVLHDDGVKSGYGHMVAVSPLPVGARVNQGDVLGLVGSTGASTGPHLHLWMGSSPNPPGVIDPTPYISGAPVGDIVTPEQMDTLGAWMKQQRELEEKTIGQWLKDVEGRLKAYIDTKIVASSGGVDVAALAKQVADEVARRMAA